MAAVHPVRQPTRIAQPDPFGDPAPRSSTTTKKQRPPPPPPPKQPTSARMAPASTNSSHNDITEAIRDTVVLRTSTDNPARAKPHRSSTQAAPAVSASRPASKRAQTDEQVDIVEKSRPSGNSRGTGKKGSQHADVIDRLDFTGVGPMFHHDGPFDACAPSRNKQRNKAPMYAWGADAVAAPQAYGDSAYPAPAAYKAFSNDYPEPPKKKVDAIAEAWGIHEPEPFEEFFAGGGTGRADGDTPTSSIYNGRDGSRNTANNSRRLKEAENRNRMNARRSLLPPPQPIFVGEASEADPAPLGSGSPPATSPGFPKRSKSIMHRIRKMRDAPNVPVGNDYEVPLPPSPSTPTDPNATSPRLSHRQQNSFLGRFAGNGASANQPHSPTEPFVFIESTHHNKDLPAPPPIEESGSGSGEYFDQQAGTGTSPGATHGLGRKTSLMKKVGRVVRGSK